jgi:hypothetical protein
MTVPGTMTRVNPGPAPGLTPLTDIRAPLGTGRQPPARPERAGGCIGPPTPGPIPGPSVRSVYQIDRPGGKRIWSAISSRPVRTSHPLDPAKDTSTKGPTRSRRRLSVAGAIDRRPRRCALEEDRHARDDGRTPRSCARATTEARSAPDRSHFACPPYPGSER